MLAFILSLIALSMVVWGRGLLTHRYRIRAITKCHERALREVGSGRDPFAQWKPYDEGMTYNQMIFDLTKWTFKDFYPELA